MKRLFWLGIGAAVGVLVVRQITKTARSFTPSGIAESARDSAGGALDSIRSFMDDVKYGMQEREAEINAAIEYGDPELVEDLYNHPEMELDELRPDDLGREP